jgi:hypothetical protein
MALMTGCGDSSKSGPPPASTGDEKADTLYAEPVHNNTKPPLIIYHISDDEIELHFTWPELESTEQLAFLAPAGDENGAYNSAANLRLERNGDEIHPFLMVFDEAMDVAYTIDDYSDEMETAIEGDTLICNIRHESIISVFKKVALWHVDTAQPLPFEGVLTDDVSAVVEPFVEGFLPDEFRKSEYDDQYFKPDSDDFIVVSYEIPIQLWLPEWYRYYGGNLHYGAYSSSKESTAKVTYLISFMDGEYAGTKIRTEYASVEDAMSASVICGYDIVPVELGLPDEKDDSLITAEFFEDCDQRQFGTLSESDHQVIYHGHYDQFRYFEFRPQDTLGTLKRLVALRLTDDSETLTYVPISSLNYTAGNMDKTELLSYFGSIEAATFSSKRTQVAGSDDKALDAINDLPGDSQYFTPMTDDYAYVIKTNVPDQGDGYYYQEVMLYSFDDSGSIIQYIYRRQYSEFLSDAFEGEEFAESFKSWTFDEAGGAYYIDYIAEYGVVDALGGMNADDTPKESLIQDLVRYGEHEGYYFSKP